MEKGKAIIQSAQKLAQIIMIPFVFFVNVFLSTSLSFIARQFFGLINTNELNTAEKKETANFIFWSSMENYNNYFKIAGAENYTLKRVDECNLEHPEIQNKPRLLSSCKIQGFLDSIDSQEFSKRQFWKTGESINRIIHMPYSDHQQSELNKCGVRKRVLNE